MDGSQGSKEVISLRGDLLALELALGYVSVCTPVSEEVSVVVQDVDELRMVLDVPRCSAETE